MIFEHDPDVKREIGNKVRLEDGTVLELVHGTECGECYLYNESECGACGEGHWEEILDV